MSEISRGNLTEWLLTERSKCREFTDKEKHWLSVIDDSYKTLANTSDKKDQWLIGRYIDYLTLMLKYENLRAPSGTGRVFRAKRLVRIHKNISTKELDLYGYNYMIFNGMYTVHEVVFVYKDICEEVFNKTHTIAGTEIPSDVLLHTIKYVTINGMDYGVFLTRSGFTEKYVQYNSSWSYPYF